MALLRKTNYFLTGVSRKKRRSGSSHPSFNPSSSDPIPSGLINILQQSSELDDNVNDYFDSVKQNGRRKRRSNGDQAPVGPIDEIEHVLECSPGWICVVVGKNRYFNTCI